jgi:hypothetical protein
MEFAINGIEVPKEVWYLYKDSQDKVIELEKKIKNRKRAYEIIAFIQDNNLAEVTFRGTVRFEDDADLKLEEFLIGKN